MAAISPSVRPPLPAGIQQELHEPLTPWLISEGLFASLSEPAPGSLYRRAQIFPDTSPKEWHFIWRYFHHDKPLRYAIKAAYVIHEMNRQKAFEANLSEIEREADAFPQTWDKETRVDQRAKAIARWKESVQPFSPFVTYEAAGRMRNWTRTKVLPLWHGTSKTVCESICKSGFTFFGKTSIPGADASSAVKSTDDGYFGSGIYFTNSAHYAADIYSKGHLLMAWVSMREPFPVVGDDNQSDMKVLMGKGAYKDYNAHYIPVAPVDSSDPFCSEYHPLKNGQEAACDEYVVFQKTQTLPQYWVELELELPELKAPSAIPQFVNEFLPCLKRVLQIPAVDRDVKLRTLLNTHLAALMHRELHDDLTAEQIVLYEQIKVLFTTPDTIDKSTRDQIIGGPSTPRSRPPQPVVSNVVAPSDVELGSLPGTAIRPVSPVDSVSTPEPSEPPVVAKKTYRDRSVYEGHLKDGLRHGQGKHTLFDGTTYEGGWKDDKENGQGVKTWFDRRVYTGEWKDGEMSGQGKMTWPDRQVYEGQWQYSKRKGQGKWTENWKVYEGEWKDDKKDGQGKYTWDAKKSYEGQWKEDKRCGQGKFTEDQYKRGWYENKDWSHYVDIQYEGEWKDDKREGDGRQVWSDGRTYDGQWHDDQRNGLGREKWPAGYKNGDEGWPVRSLNSTLSAERVYVGEYKDGLGHGQGKEINGTNIYDGAWKDGWKHGKGIQTWNGGSENKVRYDKGSDVTGDSCCIIS